MNFKADKPDGLATYNYPDGLSMLSIRYADNQAYVQDFWDTQRKQRVKDGEGRFSFAVKAEGYNEYGYSFIRYEGNIKGGRPDGNWDIFWVYDNHEQDYAGHERFENGQFKVGYDDINGGVAYYASRVQIGPSLFFLQADAMMSKGCNIDDNQDFSLFIMDKLEKGFAAYDAHSVMREPTKIELDASVNKNGILRGLDVVQGFENEEADKIIQEVLKKVAYWIPSYADDAYIDDVLHISVNTAIDEASGQLKFYNLSIHREKGI